MLTRITVLLATAAATLASAPALACSTCKCGDYTITLMGDEKPYGGRLRLGLDELARSEWHGTPADETDEWRTVLGLAYSVSEGFTIGLQLPYVRKRIDSAGLAADGIGDADLIGRWTAWRSADDTGRHRAGLRFGLRLPTSTKATDAGGAPLDIDVQPDAGARAANLGLWYAYFRFPVFVNVTATHFVFGEGRQGFRPADVTLASVQGQYALTPALALLAGIDSRYAGQNIEGGVADADSGGFFATGTLGLALRFKDDLLLHAGVQRALVEDPNGYQHEGATLRAGLAYDF